MKKCWICGRTEEQLKKEKVMDFEDNKLKEIKSIEWKHTPHVCNVCESLFDHLLSKHNLVYNETVQDEVRTCIKEIINDL